MSERVRVVTMTEEEAAVYYVMSSAPTKPELCTCGHDGLGMMWHLQGCPVNDALRALGDVLTSDDHDVSAPS